MRALAFVLLAACGAHTTAPPPEAPAEHHEHAEGHQGHHFADPERYAAHWNDPARDAWQHPEEIVAAMAAAPGSTVVDLGAGTGYLLPHLSAAVGPEGTVVATDIEPAMIAWLDEAAAREGWTNVRTRLTAPDDPGLDPASVDAVVVLDVWHHIEDRPAYAARLLQTLVPGGVVVVVDFLKEETEGGGPPVAMRLTAEQVMAELTEGGFEAELLPETMPRHYVVRGRRPTP